jgi:uncharacterized membrane protein
MWRKIRANFFTGLLLVIPVVLTFWVFYFVISRLNLLLLEPIMKIFQIWLPDRVSVEFFTKVAIFFILMALLTLTGLAARIILIRNILSNQESIFKKVVLVQYPKNGVYAIGFITSEAQGEVQTKTKENVINVFVPTTPNPTSGMLVLVPREDIILLDMSVTEGMKMIISGGAVTPKSDYGNTENRSDTFKKEGLQGN